MSKLIEVSYQDLSVHFTDEAWFNATDVADKFGKSPNDWLRLPGTQGYIEAMRRKYGNISYLKTKRGNNGGTWLHPKLAVVFARWLDDDFAVWCDDQIDGLVRGSHPHFDWQRVRHEATSSYKVMQEVLRLTRQDDGKTVAPHHFSNEARLINWALTGKFASIDRNTLSAEELDLLAHLESRNAVLIGRGVSYEKRKAALEQTSTSWRIARQKDVISNDTLLIIEA